MEPVEGGRLNKDLEEKLSFSTSGDAESSKSAELGSTSGFMKKINVEGSFSSRAGSLRKEPISVDFQGDMNEKYDREFVVLKCESNKEVSVPIALAMQSGLIRNALDAGFADGCIPIPTVPASVLKRMMEYWKMHVGQAGFSEERLKDVRQWEDEFFTRIGPDALFDLLVVANYMDAWDLLERGTDYVAEFVKIWRVDEIRAYLGMKNDFTPEEERQLMKDFPWAFEDNY
ncbi:E3 ubiquitin ligase SCF complex subunit SKP1/ASK1 family protein [Rhynchospora pubera]|uniref:E3 ubiquitin ligase SCF complex subunit SKP1/ASK1 family protein n=1 Tax=Rhynchospora pubera TaxID=906938 RepID=A0AAV8GXC3_9POAL|nr:E3 ubiquitin ligase SCF complex subunit SKP1/ASK1 family protein [Rhynchospora pubera]